MNMHNFNNLSTVLQVEAHQYVYDNGKCITFSDLYDCTDGSDGYWGVQLYVVF